MTTLLYNKFSVVIPAFNEAKTFPKVIAEVLTLKEVEELIFINDGSTDNTDARIKKFLSDPRVIYLKHAKNKGKGAAIKSGVTKAENEVILLLDADLKNITAQKIKKIALPVLKGEVDFSRASFDLARGRVTEIAVKPMMKILFPDLYFDQPISGQVCAKKSFLESLDLDQRWGVDIGLLLDAISAGQRIVEINIGKLEHKAQSDEEKAEMAKQVLETMIKKAGLIQRKYKLVIFALVDTLVDDHGFSVIYKKMKIANQMNDLQQLFDQKKINYRALTEKRAQLFKDAKSPEIEKISASVPLIKYAQEVVNALKRRKYQVAIISPYLSSVVVPVAQRLGIELIDCAYMEQKNGRYSGKITPKSIEKWVNGDLEVAFKNALDRTLVKAKVKPADAMIVAHSPQCFGLMQEVGFGIAYRPKDYILREIADKTISILPEILAIIE